MSDIIIPEAIETVSIGSRDAVECIKYWHGLVRYAGQVATMAAIMAGRELARKKEIMQHGAWGIFLTTCGLTRVTAANYINLFTALAGDEAQTYIDQSKLFKRDITKLAREVDGRALTQLYQDYGIVKRRANWGGKREGAGRKEEQHDIQAEAAEIMQSPTLADGEADDLMQKLHQFDLRGAFELIETDRLRTIRDGLYDVLEHVRAVIARRAENEK